MNTFSITESFKFGWETFKKRPWFFMGAALAMLIVSGIISGFSDGGKMNDPHVLASIIGMLVGAFMELLLLRLMLKAHDSPESVQFSDAWAQLPYLPYLGVKIVTGVIVVIGLILLIVPGLIAAAMLLFANYLVADKHLGVLDALKESMRITKGHRAKLIVLILAVALINVLGALLLFVGLVVTLPVSLLAVTHVYRSLEHKANEVVAAA